MQYITQRILINIKKLQSNIAIIDVVISTGCILYIMYSVSDTHKTGNFTCIHFAGSEVMIKVQKKLKFTY